MTTVCPPDWSVIFDPEFAKEFSALPDVVQDELLAHAKRLAVFGPQLGRPSVDSLKGSRYPNMKELRFSANRGVWRVAFAFNAERKAILLAAGDKAGTNQRRFYDRLVRLADQRFDAYMLQP